LRRWSASPRARSPRAWQVNYRYFPNQTSGVVRNKLLDDLRANRLQGGRFPPPRRPGPGASTRRRRVLGGKPARAALRPSPNDSRVPATRGAAAPAKIGDAPGRALPAPPSQDDSMTYTPVAPIVSARLGAARRRPTRCAARWRRAPTPRCGGRSSRRRKTCTRRLKAAVLQGPRPGAGFPAGKQVGAAARRQVPPAGWWPTATRARPGTYKEPHADGARSAPADRGARSSAAYAIRASQVFIYVTRRGDGGSRRERVAEAINEGLRGGLHRPWDPRLAMVDGRDPPLGGRRLHRR